MKNIQRLLFSCCMVLAFSVMAPLGNLYSQTVLDNLWMTDGTVSSIAVSGNTIYIGGDFTYVGPFTGGFAVLDTCGRADASFPKVLGTVYAIASDGSGGWYIGGDFTWVGAQNLFYIAHIKSDKTVDADWHPDADGPVRALAASQYRVYAGGQFTRIGNEDRYWLAALDRSTGNATGWNPSLAYDGMDQPSVHAIALSGTLVYAGGTFTDVGAAARNNLAAIDSASGIATSWDPDAGGCIHSLAIAPSTVYAAGEFASVGESSRDGIAAIDSATGTAKSWDAKLGEPYGHPFVYAVAVSDSSVYAGGQFKSVDKADRNFLAVLDTVTGTARDWNANLNASEGGEDGILALAVSDTSVYAGGQFQVAGDTTWNNIAAFDKSTGQLKSWNPNGDNMVWSLSIYGSNVSAGGLFTSIGRQTRKHIAALDASTGAATDWNPKADSTVTALAVSGSTVYAGGYFTGKCSMGDSTRNHIAALDASTGRATGWNPRANDAVYALAVSGSTVYVGGEFYGAYSIGDSTRNHIAAIDSSTGRATAWNPNTDGYISALAVSGSTVYAGGSFATIGRGDSTRYALAALDAGTGVATDWNPNVDGNVYALALFGSTVYAGGWFAKIGSDDRSNIAAIDMSTGNATSWAPDADNTVLALATSGSTVYAGGAFTNIGRRRRPHLAALDAFSGTATNWSVDADNNVTTLALDFSNARVYAGGDFTNIYEITRGHFVGLTNPDDPALPVQLVALSAKVSGTAVELVWNTATEVSSYGFDIQRKSLLNSELKTQNSDWTKVGFVPGAGSSNKKLAYTFTDRDLPQGRYAYRLKQIDRDGSFKYSQVTEVAVGSIPLEFSLAQNYPNPFNPSTTIRYGLPSPSKVKLIIHDLLGREIRTLVDEEQAAGWQEVRWDAKGISSGIYFYTLRGGSFVQTRKLVMMK